MTPNFEMRKNLTAFEDELIELINKHCLVSLSETPDYILARYLMGCIYLFNTTVECRDNWWDQYKKRGTK